MRYSKEEITQLAGDEVLESNIKENPEYKWIEHIITYR